MTGSRNLPAHPGASERDMSLTWTWLCSCHHHTNSREAWPMAHGSCSIAVSSEPRPGDQQGQARLCFWGCPNLSMDACSDEAYISVWAGVTLKWRRARCAIDRSLYGRKAYSGLVDPEQFPATIWCQYLGVGWCIFACELTATTAESFCRL